MVKLTNLVSWFVGIVESVNCSVVRTNWGSHIWKILFQTSTFLTSSTFCQSVGSVLVTCITCCMSVLVSCAVFLQKILSFFSVAEGNSQCILLVSSHFLCVQNLCLAKTDPSEISDLSIIKF